MSTPADFLQNLIQNIVDQPEAIQVNDSQVEPGLQTLEISVANSDMGKIIGKGGKTIKAIRDLTRIIAAKNSLRVNVVLKES